ncbi:type II toxin-antitoxin system RelE family toxin [Aerococcus urinaehominis]|uniref:type II toxin-antitoxin system RelE family toxin n=2 Tax=Aerococcus urinaehominis TaxID=128944 RepID=UPI0022864CB5|nr:type II toxin-antitoxin system RelE/ParE family toxin [Aerococcus urinaehominis]
MSLLRNWKTTYSLELSKTAIKQLRKMNQHISIMLVKARVKELDGLEDPRSKGKALSSQLKGLWRYRVGQYRIICEI